MNRESQCFHAMALETTPGRLADGRTSGFVGGAEQSGATILVAVFEQPDGPRKGRCSERKLEACATLLFKPACCQNLTCAPRRLHLCDGC